MSPQETHYADYICQRLDRIAVALEKLATRKQDDQVQQTLERALADVKADHERRAATQNHYQ